MSAASAVAATRSDVTKLRTVRPTVLTLLLTFALCAGLGFLLALTFSSAVPGMSGEQRERFDPLFATFYSVMIGQLALVVFGVLAIGGEYSSGTIRASLAAMPRRGVFYAGKVLAVALLAAGTAVVTVPVTYVAAQTALGRYATDLDEPGVLAAVVGAAIYLPLICLFAFGVTAMLRSSTYALGILLPVFFLGSQGLGNIPKVRTVAQYLPDQAGSVIMHIVGPPDGPDYDRAYGPWTGLGILALWTAAALVGGYLTLRRKDA